MARHNTHRLEQDQMEVETTWDKTQSITSFSRLHAGFSTWSKEDQEGGMTDINDFFVCFFNFFLLF